jgi:hypothetical protein
MMEKIDARERRLAVGLVAGAEMIGMSPSWLKQKIREKEVKAVHLGDRVLIRVSELERLLKDGERSRGAGALDT